ncbi:MAG: hypothetical protein RDV48_09360 [Candidatus Eremiobacteraeota bacterium]|nr:hypothetical protein [Candidatus Eremiobacteraeota bacterium]
MGKGSAKKPGEPKCRGCGGLLEGKEVVKVGGNKWHKECAEQKGKKIPKEYQSAS